MPIPPILIIVPPRILVPKGPIAAKFTGAAEKSAGLSDAYRAVAAELGCLFFDAGSVTSASAVDGIHLDADQHQSLGKALARFIAALPGVLPSALPGVLPPAVK
jgi:lysophospholipase L1-like esterase